MSESPYTKLELDLKFKELHDKLDEIITQNSNLRSEVVSLRAWRIGVTMLTAGAIVIVLPLVVYAYIQDLSRLETSVDNVKKVLEIHLTQ